MVSVAIALDGVTVTPSNFMVMTELAAKPLPWLAGINTVEPAFPVVGKINTCGDTVTDWLAVWLAESLALIVCVPVTDTSTCIIATKPPLELVVTEDGEVVPEPTSCPNCPMAVPSNDIVINEFGAKLLPVILTSVPTLTELVLRQIVVPVLGHDVVALVVALAVFDGELVPTLLIADTR